MALRSLPRGGHCGAARADVAVRSLADDRELSQKTRVCAVPTGRARVARPEGTAPSDTPLGAPGLRRPGQVACCWAALAEPGGGGGPTDFR